MVGLATRICVIETGVSRDKWARKSRAIARVSWVYAQPQAFGAVS